MSIRRIILASVIMLVAAAGAYAAQVNSNSYKRAGSIYGRSDGMYTDTSNTLHLIHNGTSISEFGDEVINNAEVPTPTTVTARIKVNSPPHGTLGGTETAAFYCKNDMEPGGATQFNNCIYLESDEDQNWVAGATIKIIHKGAGDAVYVAHLGGGTDGKDASTITSSFGYESAMFGGWQDWPTNTISKQENGFIATLQGTGGFQQSVPDQSNATGFQALVHDDGVDPTAQGFLGTNYGLFYANNSLSNAFVARTSQYASNFSQFKLMDHTANQRPKWQVFNDGQMWTNGPEATSGTTTQNAPPIIMRSYYWDGDSEENAQIRLQAGVTTDPYATLNIYAGPSATETLVAYFSEDADGAGDPGLNLQNNSLHAVGKVQMQLGGGGVDLQNNDVTQSGSITANGSADRLLSFQDADFTGTTLRLQQARTPASSSEACNVGDFCWDADYWYVCVAASTWKRSAHATW